MSINKKIAYTDFNQTLQNVWLKSVLCSKLGGGLANSLIDFNVDVPPLQYNYDEIKAMLHERILRNSDCVRQKASYVSMPDRMRSLDNMYDQDRRERDLYFYHSDHLGSSSFITDAYGITTQHLQYLPYGELFVEQRSTANYFTPYKFSAKEKDEETSYSYFGARYLASDFSLWLSVDPLADKYPNISPYAYCAWNPVMLVDPDGRSSSPYYDVNGNYLGVDENGFKGNIYITTKDAYNNSKVNGVTNSKTLQSNSSTKELYSQKNSLTKASINKILNDVINKTINPDGTILSKGTYSASYYDIRAIDNQEANAIYKGVQNGIHQMGFDAGDYEWTVENIRLTAIHEIWAHGMEGFNDNNKKHHLCYQAEMDSKYWKNSTERYKKHAATVFHEKWYEETKNKPMPTKYLNIIMKYSKHINR